MILKSIDLRTALLIGLSVLFAILLCKTDPNDSIMTGLYGGMFTGVFTVLMLDFYERLKFIIVLRHLTSTKWIGWALVDRKLAKHKAGNVEFNSFAEISHEGDNILSIILRHRKSEASEDNRSWIGQIVLNRDSLKKGSLTYEYVDSKETGHRDVLIHTDKDNRYIYLIPVDNKIHFMTKNGDQIIPTYEFGTEVLIKQR